MARTFKHKEVIGTRIHGALYQSIEEIMEKRQISKSQLLKEALSVYLDRFDGVETPEQVQKVINDSEAMKDALAEDYFIENQNFKISTKLKELTFLEFMDKNLSIVYLANKPHMSEDQLIEHLKTTLESLEERAKHHGYESQYKERLDSPKAYAEEFLDRKSLEEKAFNDFMDSI